MICNAKDRAGLVVGATVGVEVQISNNRAAGLPALRHGISVQFEKASLDRAAARRHPPRSTRLPLPPGATDTRNFKEALCTLSPAR